MAYVRIPVNSLGVNHLTIDQLNLLTILEDAILMFVRDEVQFLRWLPEIMHGSKLVDSYCIEILSIINRRMKKIRNSWGKEMTEQYETTLLEAVDECDTERANLKREIQAALVQKVRWQDIERADHIATASGLLDLAQQLHTLLTGKKHTYDGAREALWMVDIRLECHLLNEGKLPQFANAQQSFTRLFDRLCVEVRDKFTEKTQKLKQSQTK